MKRNVLFILIAACCLSACAHKHTSQSTEATKRYFDAWVHVQKQDHPEYLWKQTALGSWILEEKQGSGQAVGEFQDSLYLLVNYTNYDLDGTITATTSAIVSQQIGTYDETAYYGPGIWYAKGIYAGFEDVIKDMKPGGRRKFVMPGWLRTYDRYDSIDGYLNQEDDKMGATAIFDIELRDYFPHIMDWAADSVGRYLAANYSARYGADPAAAAADTSGAYGFWYIQEKAPADTVTLKDTTVYINYIGRLLNGRVFDTTIRDTAIVYGLDRDKDYAPVAINYGTTWSDVTMGSDQSKVVPGFARTLFGRKSHEKGTGIFIFSLGYGHSGSGSKIPAYAPLRFDIELVDNPE